MKAVLFSYTLCTIALIFFGRNFCSCLSLARKRGGDTATMVNQFEAPGLSSTAESPYAFNADDLKKLEERKPRTLIREVDGGGIYSEKLEVDQIHEAAIKPFLDNYLSLDYKLNLAFMGCAMMTAFPAEKLKLRPQQELVAKEFFERCQKGSCLKFHTVGIGFLKNYKLKLLHPAQVRVLVYLKNECAIGNVKKGALNYHLLYKDPLKTVLMSYVYKASTMGASHEHDFLVAFNKIANFAMICFSDYMLTNPRTIELFNVLFKNNGDVKRASIAPYLKNASSNILKELEHLDISGNDINLELLLRNAFGFYLHPYEAASLSFTKSVVKTIFDETYKRVKQIEKDNKKEIEKMQVIRKMLMGAKISKWEKFKLAASKTAHNIFSGEFFKPKEKATNQSRNIWKWIKNPRGNTNSVPEQYETVSADGT